MAVNMVMERGHIPTILSEPQPALWVSFETVEKKFIQRSFLMLGFGVGDVDPPDRNFTVGGTKRTTEIELRGTVERHEQGTRSALR